MRISYSRYTAFLQNPERYRLSYGLGLTPEGDDTPTRMNLGRRRGSCFHALYEAKAGDYETERAVIAAKFGLDLVARCESMMAVVPNLGPLEFVEQEFEVPIGDGKHSIHGFIDHAFVNADGNFSLGDFKTTKGNRTKKELSEYLSGHEVSPQSHFYLKAAAALGKPTNLFTFHVVLDRKDKDSEPRYIPLDLHIGPAEVERTMASVYAAAEGIEFYTNVIGVEKPWPHSVHWPCSGDKFFCGFQNLCGRHIPKGCIPPGFTNRYADLIQVEGA